MMEHTSENKHYDLQLRAMLSILEHDYAGIALSDASVDSRYYIQAAGMAWKEGTLDGLTFLRFGSQMLATTMDRSLRLSLDGEDYAPWRPGFDVRRIGDSLYVTGIQEEQRLRPGDRILRLNALAPDQHKRQFQKNFLYADEPEREMWGNVLKMTAHVLAVHADGTQEDIPLARYTDPRPTAPQQLIRHPSGAVILSPGSMPDAGALSRLIDVNRNEIDRADKLIIDLRACRNGDEAAFLPLMPYILSNEKTMSEAAGLQQLRTLYTADNCRRRMQQLSPFAGHPAADVLLAELEKKRGAGFITEEIDLWADIPESISPRGQAVFLLTDTFTEGAAEAFALLAKKEGRAKLIGRATMGSLDYADMISVALSPEITFTYPMSITLDAAQGRGYKGKGVQPDVVLPFIPEECLRDLILERAMQE